MKSESRKKLYVALSICKRQQLWHKIEKKKNYKKIILKTKSGGKVVAVVDVVAIFLFYFYFVFSFHSSITCYVKYFLFCFCCCCCFFLSYFSSGVSGSQNIIAADFLFIFYFHFLVLEFRVFSIFIKILFSKTLFLGEVLFKLNIPEQNCLN